MIEFKQISYSYPHSASPALDDITININDGDEIAIIGGNGSGKTTLGLLLAGILNPDSGRIHINGLSPGEISNQFVGFLFQDPDNGLVATTVEREVAFSLENQNLPPDIILREVNRTLKVFDIERYRERLIWNLSGGEKQRLSLAALIAASPSLLFLDEPASYLDYEGAQKLEDMLRRIKEHDPSLTIIRVTQYPLIAQTYARVIFMHSGKIILDGSPKDVFAHTDILMPAGIRPPLEYLTPKQSPIPSREPQTGNHRHALIELLDIDFKYDGNKEGKLLDGLSLTVMGGEVVSLVGPSGGGKSTLAQIICGIYKTQGGTIRRAKPDLRAVMSFQQPEKQFFRETVFDEIAFGIEKRFNDRTELSRAVENAMEMAGLDFDDFSPRDPHNLSGGEARRLGFAIIIALDADLLIFDEPTSGLDEFGIIRFKRLVRHLIESGKTVMIISHNSDIVGSLSNRIAVLRGGRIDLTTDPMTFFTTDTYKGILERPEVIEYQLKRLGNVVTTRAEDIFELDKISA